MAQEPQTLKNHTRFHPPFHFFLAPVAIIFFIEGIIRLARNQDWSNVLHLVGTIWAVVVLYVIRGYALKVQDRLIHLEERIRMKELLPAGLQGRIGELGGNQLIALRFASDGELAGLVQKALDGKWNRKQIKEAIKTWRPDNCRV